MNQQDFFSSINNAMEQNHYDIAIIFGIIAFAVFALIYVYYVYPKYSEIVYKKKVINFIAQRYNFSDYELDAINSVIRKNGIDPQYLFYISQSLFEKHEKELAAALKDNCPKGVSADERLVSIKERLFS